VTSGSVGRSSSRPLNPDKALVSGGEYAPESDESGIDVPDVSGGYGDDAWRSVEDAELSPTFADANEDISFESSRDGTGCEVTDHSPAAGEPANPGEDVEVTIDCAQVDY
jgi:beta-lactam-binding protein with PASTA domain